MKKFLLAAALIAVSTNAYAVNPALTAQSKKPVNIESDSLVYESKSGAAIFTGNVKVVQEGMEITANQMKVFSDKTKKTNEKAGVENEIDTDFKRIEAFGNVNFRNNESYGKANEAVFEIKEEVLTLMGDVYLNQKGNELFGEKFIYNLKTERYDVFNSTGTGAQKGRVKLILNQESKGNLTKGSVKKFQSGAPKE
jgi:lipopolysaccharide export system protein LptA